MPEIMDAIKTLPPRETIVAEVPEKCSDLQSYKPFEVQRSRTELLARVLYNLPKSIWAIVDATSVCIGNYIGYQIFHIQFPQSTWIADMTLVNAVVAIAFVVSGVVVGLYEAETVRHRSRIAVRSFLTIALAIAISFLVMHTLMYEVFSRRIAVMAPIAFLGISGCLRMATYRLLYNLKRRILFVGCGNSVKRVYQAMKESEEVHGFILLGYVSVENDKPASDGDEIAYLGNVDDVQPICRANDVDEIVIGVEEQPGTRLSKMIMASLRLGCRVTNQPTFHERIFGEVPAAYIDTDWFLSADLDGHRQERATLKRVFDVAFAFVLLILTLPFWPLIALAIKLDDSGPIFYTQQRVGCHNRIFKLAKFRTMRQDAEIDGHVWSAPGDPRVTRFGRFLRRTHIDEFPQLWNILLGDMSVVGPRPERPEFVEELIKEIAYFDERHLVKPGLTGWAQVNYRYGCNLEDARKKFCLDLYYIKHMSLELDLAIIFRTLGTLFVSPA